MVNINDAKTYLLANLGSCTLYSEIKDWHLTYMAQVYLWCFRDVWDVCNLNLKLVYYQSWKFSISFLFLIASLANDYDGWLLFWIYYPPRSSGFQITKMRLWSWVPSATQSVGGMGEVGGGRLAMPGTSGGTPAERRQEILETTLQAVKRCQVSITVMQTQNTF